MGHTAVTWEIVLPMIAIVIFIAEVELWKYAKRVYYRRKLHKAGIDEDETGMTGVFAAWKTVAPGENNTRDPAVVV